MKFLHKYGTRSIEIRRAKRELIFRLALAAAVLLFFAFMVVITKFRPRLEEGAALPPSARAAGDPVSSPELAALRNEASGLLDQFLRAEAGGTLDLEDIELLEKAIGIQRQVIRNRSSEIAPRADLDRLETLQTHYDESMGSFLLAQSRLMASKARSLWAEGNTEEAIEALEKARLLQQDINSQYPRSSAQSTSRLFQLEKEALDWQTRPVAEKADRLMQTALEQMERGQYAEARALMREALDDQRQLNEAHRNSRFTSVARTREFELNWQRVQTAQNADRIEALLLEADRAMAIDDHETALRLAGEAEALNRSILTEFPGLEPQRRQTGQRIMAMMDSAASLPLFQRQKQLHETLDHLLRTRDLPRIPDALTEWHRAMEDFRRRFPESRFRPELAEAKSDFLHAIRGDLLSLLTQLSDGLRDVPGFPGWRLFHSEVPQQLYERVMGTNPSGNPGPRFPVESLSWREAHAFTERVSWILAAEAQLPPEDLFLAASGRPGPQQLARQAWHSRNSERVPAPVATSTPNEDGFFDLYGNVDEWLFSPDDPPGSVQTAGGSARDNILTLAEMPRGTHSPDDRSRFIGFRFAVNLFPDPQ